MRRQSRRRAPALTMVVLTAAVALCGHVQAQQTGLFPLAPIRRQRVPCDQEDPTYKIYKHQYFGYHPTCWRTFPPGWGCPSAEAPNKERSFKELKPGQVNEEEAIEAGPGPGDEGAPPPDRRRPGLPELPPDRVDPFQMDQPAGGVPNVAPLPRGNARPGAQPAPRDTDPFRDLNQGDTPPPARGRSGSRDTPTPPAGGTPELAAPSGPPAQGSASRSGGDQAEGEVLASGEEGPLLGLSDSDLVRSDNAASGSDSPAGIAGNPASTAGSAVPGRAGQPRRRIFGNLFSSLGTNWLRR